jgi:hypothetical protein
MMGDGWHVCTLGWFHRDGHKGPLDMAYTLAERRLAQWARRKL